MRLRTLVTVLVISIVSLTAYSAITLERIKKNDTFDTVRLKVNRNSNVLEASVGSGGETWSTNAAITNVDMAGFRIINLGNPVDSGDALSWGYFTNFIYSIAVTNVGTWADYSAITNVDMDDYGLYDVGSVRGFGANSSVINFTNNTMIFGADGVSGITFDNSGGGSEGSAFYGLLFSGTVLFTNNMGCAVHGFFNQSDLVLGGYGSAINGNVVAATGHGDIRNTGNASVILVNGFGGAATAIDVQNTGDASLMLISDQNAVARNSGDQSIVAGNTATNTHNRVILLGDVNSVANNSINAEGGFYENGVKLTISEPTNWSYYVAVSNILPYASNAVDIGSASLWYANLYCKTGHFDSSTVFLGDTKVIAVDGTLATVTNGITNLYATRMWITNWSTNIDNVAYVDRYNVFDDSNTFNDVVTIMGADYWKGGTDSLIIGDGTRTGTVNYVTALGMGAASGNSGGAVVALGSSAGKNSSASSSAFIGLRSGQSASGANVFAAGIDAGNGNTGGDVAFIGDNAGKNNTGNDVIGIGDNAGRRAAGTSSGDYGVYLGKFAGYEETNDNVTIIGEWNTTWSRTVDRTSDDQAWVGGDLHLYNPPSGASAGNRLVFESGAFVAGSNNISFSTNIVPVTSNLSVGVAGDVSWQNIYLGLAGDTRLCSTGSVIQGGTTINDSFQVNTDVEVGDGTVQPGNFGNYNIQVGYNIGSSGDIRMGGADGNDACLQHGSTVWSGVMAMNPGSGGMYGALQGGFVWGSGSYMIMTNQAHGALQHLYVGGTGSVAHAIMLNDAYGAVQLGYIPPGTGTTNSGVKGALTLGPVNAVAQNSINVKGGYYVDGVALNAPTNVVTLTGVQTVTGGKTFTAGTNIFDGYLVVSTTDTSLLGLLVTNDPPGPSGPFISTNVMVVNGNIVPADSDAKLGTSDNPWESLYIQNASIFMGTNKISVSDGVLAVSALDTNGVPTTTNQVAYVDSPSGGTSTNLSDYNNDTEFLVTGGIGASTNLSDYNNDADFLTAVSALAYENITNVPTFTAGNNVVIVTNPVGGVTDYTFSTTGSGAPATNTTTFAFTQGRIQYGPADSVVFITTNGAFFPGSYQGVQIGFDNAKDRGILQVVDNITELNNDPLEYAASEHIFTFGGALEALTMESTNISFNASIPLRWGGTAGAGDQLVNYQTMTNKIESYGYLTSESDPIWSGASNLYVSTNDVNLIMPKVSNIALGLGADVGTVGTVTLGRSAGESASGAYYFAAGGQHSGDNSSGNNWAAIGYESYGLAVGNDTMSFGNHSGYFSKGDYCNYLGQYAGYFNKGTNVTAIGSWAGRSGSGNGRVYIDAYTSDPGSGNAGTNDSIYINGLTKNIYLGRSDGTLALRGDAEVMQTAVAGNDVVNWTVLTNQIAGASSTPPTTNTTTVEFQQGLLVTNGAHWASLAQANYAGQFHNTNGTFAQLGTATDAGYFEGDGGNFYVSLVPDGGGSGWYAASFDDIANTTILHIMEQGRTIAMMDGAGNYVEMNNQTNAIDVQSGNSLFQKAFTSYDATNSTEIVNYQTMTNWVTQNSTPPATNNTTVEFSQMITFPSITVAGQLIDGSVSTISVANVVFDADFIPDTSNTYDIGSTDLPISMAYIGTDASANTEAVNYHTMQAQKAWGIVGITNQTTYTTPSTYTAVTNWLTTGVSDQVTLTTTGLVCTVAGDYTVEAIISASGGNSATHNYQLQKNGTAILFGTQPRKLGTAGDIGNTSISSQVTLASNDVVNLAVKADSGDVVIEKAHVRILRLGD